jgi:putative membrane protein
MGRTVLRWITVLGQGMAIGVANVIPGVSGGTMALIFGIYEKLISLLGDLFKASISLVRLDFQQTKSLLASIPWAFLLLLSAGVLVAPLAGAALIPDLLDAWPEHSRSLFFGLILGTIPIPWIRIKNKNTSQLLILILAAAASFLLVGLPHSEVVNPSLWVVFFAAALSICAMILPGVSGAFVLIVIGMYGPIFAAIDARNISVILVFALGAGVGLGSFALVLKALLTRAHDATMAALVGLMIGSLRSLWPWLSADQSLFLPDSFSGLGPILALGTLGLAISVGMTVLELKSNALKARPETD